MQRDPRKILEIISEETRYEILKLIISKGRYLTVAEIAENLLKDKKTIDKHLRILLEYKLIDRKYLENEKAYGYYVTSFTSYLLNSINKAFETNIVSSEFKRDEKQETVKIVRRKITISYSFVIGVIFILLGFLIGFGSRLYIIPPGNETAKLIALVIFTLIGIYMIVRNIKHG